MSAYAPPEISHASGSRAYTADGRALIDLMNGFGSVFLGHCHPGITEATQRQLSRIWNAGRLPNAAHREALDSVARLLPQGLRPAGLCSTGMEAAEFALRLAAVQTGRNEFAAFQRSMHGKSTMTAALCWGNAPVRPGSIHSLPFVPSASEDEILQQLSALLERRRVAAVFVEPIQGSNGAHEASAQFYDAVIAACAASGTQCIFDEILTGLYRTGPAFYVEGLSAQPDMILFAKSMANGFPVSAVAIRNDIAVSADTLPGSTFSGNPIAAAAVSATLRAMGELAMPARVEAISACVRAAFADHGEITLRGRGALWALEVDRRVDMDRAVARILDAGVMVSWTQNHIRVLPSALIDIEELRDACGKIARACAAAYH